jgi:hypothetical protein
MTTRPLLLIVLLTFALLSHPARIPNRLFARIVDDADGRPLAARVSVADADGRPLEIDGSHAHVQYLGRRWCYVDGSFSVPIPDSSAAVAIRRGFETRPVSETVTVDAAAGKTARTFRLRRWIDMRGKGYVSGDIHAHLPAPAEAPLQMRGEDLNVANLMMLGGVDVPANGHFAGRLDAGSTPGCELYVGQEIQEWQMGHLTLLGLKSVVPGYGNPGGTLEYWTSHPHWDLGRAMRAARRQDGFVSWAHFENLPGFQSPVGVALGLVDAIELPTWSDATQLPAHWGPWDDSGMSQAEFTVMRGVDLYYQFLNAGFHLPIAAGTDKVGEDMPLGSNRTYVPVKAAADYAGWLAGVKRGTGFVTNGPILEFEVEGHGPGDTIELEGTKRVKARIRARSILPFTTLDIVLNGRTVGHKRVPIPANPPVDGVYTMEVEATVDLAGSAWLAARVLDDPDLNPRVLPRGVSVFAHTNPVYFRKDGRKVREQPSIAYLRKWVTGFLRWLESNPSFADAEDRRNARQDAEQALRVLDGL